MPIALNHGFHLVHVLASFTPAPGSFKLNLVAYIHHLIKIKQKKYEFAAITVLFAS